MAALTEGKVLEAGPPVLLSQLSLSSTPSCDKGKENELGATKVSQEDRWPELPAGAPSASKPQPQPQRPQQRAAALLLGFATLPCQLFRFVAGLHAKFGGFVPVGALQYGVNQGLGMGMGGLAQRYFLKDTLGLRHHPALMQNLRTAAKIPWNIKPVMGMLSDAFPLFGYHRTSYMGVAAGCGAVAYACLGSLPLAAIATLPFFVLINVSVAVPDVMIDATAAKLSKDSPESASDLQSLVWGSLPMGLLVSCALSGTLEEVLGPKMLLLITAVCPLTVLMAALARLLPEERLPKGQRKLDLTFLKQHGPVTILAAVMSAMSVTLSVLQVVVESAHIRGICVLVCGMVLALSIYLSLRQITPILAKTALFIFVRECLQPNLGDPMFVWLTDEEVESGPKFGPQLMGALEGVGAVAMFAGVVLYNKYLTNISYRKIFLMAQLSLVFTNMSDLILVKRWNLQLGIPDVVFVMGDDAFGTMIGRFFMMPLFVLSSKVCPDNLEATLFAMLMALSNFGSTVGDFFGSTLCDLLGVDNGDFSMLPEAVIAKSICRLLPIPLIFLLVPNLTPQDPIPGVEAAAGDAATDAAADAGEGEPRDEESAEERGVQAAIEASPGVEGEREDNPTKEEVRSTEIEVEV